MGLLRTASLVPICNSRTPTQCLLLSSRIIGKTRLHVMMQREHITKNCRGARSTTCLQVYLQAKKRITEERLKAYNEKKAKKPKVIAKTSVLSDVKPWDDETDMDAMKKACVSIEMDGLLWGASKLVPVGYGINKLQLMCTVEDEKVSIEELSEKMAEFEDFVQSVDVAAMNKI